MASGRGKADLRGERARIAVHRERGRGRREGGRGSGCGETKILWTKNGPNQYLFM